MPNVNTTSPSLADNLPPTPSGMDAPRSTQCTACAEYYTVRETSDPDLCRHCEHYMTATAPKTAEEQFCNDYIKKLDSAGLASLGLGNYYFGLDQAQDPLRPVQHVQTTPRDRAFDTSRNPLNMPEASPVPQTVLPAPSMGAPSAMPPTYPTMIMGYQPHQAPPHKATQRQAVEAQRLQQRYAYFQRRGLDATKLLPERRTAYQYHAQLYSAPPTYPGMKLIPAERLEDVPVAAVPKKRRQRLICSVCRKDAPVTRDNDGVNCTRCCKKILKAEQREAGMQ